MTTSSVYSLRRADTSDIVSNASVDSIFTVSDRLWETAFTVSEVLFERSVETFDIVSVKSVLVLSSFPDSSPNACVVSPLNCCLQASRPSIADIAYPRSVDTAYMLFVMSTLISDTPSDIFRDM